MEHVGTAYSLEKTLTMLEEEQAVIEQAKPTPPREPNKPVLHYDQIMKESYPKITFSTLPDFPKIWRNAAIIFGIMTIYGTSLCVSFLFMPLHSTMLYLTFFSFALFVTCIVTGYAVKKGKQKRAAQMIEQVRNSTEYRQQCAEIDARNRRRQEEENSKLKEQYEAALKCYENNQMPKYKKELEYFELVELPTWEDRKSAIAHAITETRATLEEVYACNIIPSIYRNLNALAFIASFMGTSNYDLKFAIERYDKEIDQIIARQQLNVSKATAVLMRRVLREQQSANYLQAQAIDYLTEGNRLLKHTKNWAAASTALQAVDIIADWRRAKG